MSKSRKRAPLWTKVNTEYCLNGEIRQILKPSERSVWLDFICLAMQGGGVVSIYSRATQAKILAIPKSLLDRSIDKMEQAGIIIKHNPSQIENNCEKYSIPAWEAIQDNFYKDNALQRISASSNDADSMPRGEESREDENRENKNSSEESNQEDTTIEDERPF
jgi:hypothetical protein